VRIMRKVLAFGFGILTTICFAATSLYCVLFLADVLVPRTIDRGPSVSWPVAVAVDLALVGLFAAQHSVMARAAFKRWWTRVIPPAIERSVYVLAACLALALLVGLWLPLPDLIWSVTNPAGRILLSGLFWFGWLMVLIAGLLTNQAEMLGLQQISDAVHGRVLSPPTLNTSGLYRLVRHPIYVGSFIGFWATPDMTVGHLLFAVAATVYTVAGARLEERDLVRTFGDGYRRYQRDVRMLLPIPRRAARGRVR